MTYLEIRILSVRFIAKPTETGIVNPLNGIEEFLSPPSPPAAPCIHLLGHLSSLTLLIKGGMLRMRSLQLRLRPKRNFQDDYLRIPGDPLCHRDLLGWSYAVQQRQGGDNSPPNAGLELLPGSFQRRLGRNNGGKQMSGVYTPSKKQVLITLKKMMVI